MLRLTLVVPCYNEADRLDLQAFRDHVKRHPDNGFMFVDDGSTDRTWEMLEGLKGEDPDRFVIYRMEKNAGKAEAVRQGVARAFESGSPYVGFWDADLATPLSEAPAFVKVLDSDDDLAAVFAARVRMLGRAIDRKPMRHFLGRVFATAASLVLRIQVYDTQCGAKLFRTTPAVRRAFEEPFLSSWIFDVEIIARLQEVGGANVYEFPLNTWRDEGGSKIKLLDYVRVPWDLFRIRRHYPRTTASDSGDSR